MSAPPPFDEAPMLSRFSLHLRHGFFSRSGGVSAGPYKSLNCGTGTTDDPARIAENRKRAAEALGARSDRLIGLTQIHSARVVRVEAPFPGPPPQADGLVSDRPGLMLSVLTADCAPVLFADPHANVIGAAHAGWRGAMNGVLEATVEAMCDIGAEPGRIVAAVGPCLSGASFEVGPDLVEAVLAVSPFAEPLFSPGEGDRHFFDFKRYVAFRLARAGLPAIDLLADDTLAESERLFSYRAARKAGQADTGRNLSGILLLA
jgi:hypothetical protein